MSRPSAPLARLSLLSLEPAVSKDELGEQATFEIEDPLGKREVAVFVTEAPASELDDEG